MTTANTHIASIKLEDPDYPLLTPTYINQEIVEKNGNFITFNRLAQLKTALDALQPNPPNNHTVLFEDTLQVQNVGATQTAELNNNSLSLQGTGATPTYVYIQADYSPPNNTNIVITDNTYYNASTLYQTIIGDIISNTSTTVANNMITMDTSAISGPINTITSGDMTINDFGAINNTQITADYLRFTNSSTGISTDYNASSISSNAVNDYVFDNQGSAINGDFNSKFVYRSGRCDRVESINNSVNDHIEIWANHYVSENGNDVYLYRNDKYRNQIGNGDGWYCHLTNLSGGSINLTSDDGTEFVSHTNGITAGIMPIKKYATVRITLIYAPSASLYYWAVSEF